MAEEKIELTEEEFLEAIKAADLGNSLAKYTQKIGDQRVSSGIESFKKNLQAKDFTDKERLETVEAELKQLKDTNVKSTLNNSIKDSLKVAGLSEGFLKYIKVDKEEDIGSAVKDLKDNILGLEQLNIDMKLKGNNPPLTGDKTFSGSGMETAVKDYAKKISIKE